MQPASCSFRHKPTLQGAAVVLRPVDEADAAFLADVDPETLRLTGTHAHALVDMDALRTWYRTRGDHEDRIDLSILERARDLRCRTTGP